VKLEFLVMSLKYVNGAAIIAVLAGIAYSQSVQAAITVTSGYVDCATNGTVGRAGSTSGLNTDDPPQLNGTGGLITLAASSAGGPVPPQVPFTSFPGTLASHAESASVYQDYVGDGTTYLIVTQDAQFTNSLTNMDGDGLSATSNANGVTRMAFTVTSPTPYTLQGTLLLDDQDVAGSVRLTTSLGIALYSRFVANNGTFSTSGTLNPGNYILHSNAGVTATAGQPDVGNTGNFGESGSYHVVFTLGTPPACDSIDFNNDGLFPDSADIDDFLSVFSGGACSNDPFCGDIDFNNDGLFPDSLDIDSLLSVFSGGACL
jgi:hypothetical protein